MLLFVWLSVNPGAVKHLQSRTAGGDTVLIQFYSPRHDYMFQYSLNVSCSPDEFTSVSFTCEHIADEYFRYCSE